ncbi:hypothetical protein [Sphingobacterium sp. HMA12]|nr:hypothetical protein [Sphingobacterium sp. HMA12]
MARQVSLVKFEGKIPDLAFYKLFQFVNGGYYFLSNGIYNALTFVQVIQP